MSRVQVSRGVIPRLWKDFNQIEIWHNPLGSLTFDPSITTSVSTTVIWETEVGSTVTTGTSHALSYTPTAGAKVCKVTVQGGLGLVTGIDSNTDAITLIKNSNKCKLSGIFSIYGNVLLSLNLDEYPNLISIIATTMVRVTGTTAKISRYLTNLQCANCLISGSVADLPSTLTTKIYLSGTLVTPGNISHLTGAQLITMFDLGWLAADVDLVLMSIGNAILANAAHFTYATPSIQIGGTNEAPGGTYQAPSGPGGTITSGLEAVWVMVHNVGHAWTVTVTGSGPY